MLTSCDSYPLPRHTKIPTMVMTQRACTVRAMYEPRQGKQVGGIGSKPKDRCLFKAMTQQLTRLNLTATCLHLPVAIL